ncbi:EKC/KEOPS complex subunit LAGE3 [Struthio camelus]|uniref:EKC/KEOPS complex subunit LAGE3 n=1 Tax=Struthio camelus TaxID=8801 RepID=UPI003603F327
MAAEARDGLEFRLSVPFPSALEAQIAHGSLAPDAQPRRGGVRRDLALDGPHLQARWWAPEARSLRVAVGSFLEHLELVVETMERFGPPRPR